MNRRMLLVTAASLMMTAPAFAQTAATPATPATPPVKAAVMAEKPMGQHGAMHEKWKNATPEERAKMKEMHKARMKERYENATPEQRARMDERREKWKNATPEERKQMRMEHHKNKAWHKENHQGMDGKGGMKHPMPKDKAPAKI